MPSVARNANWNSATSVLSFIPSISGRTIVTFIWQTSLLDGVKWSHIAIHSSGQAIALFAWATNPESLPSV